MAALRYGGNEIGTVDVVAGSASAGLVQADPRRQWSIHISDLASGLEIGGLVGKARPLATKGHPTLNAAKQQLSQVPIKTHG